MNKSVELLAPAGSYEAFLAAVENGANAVYLGGKFFNARANATNFELDELEKIVDYAHLRDVKIYVTLNTLLNDKEIEKAIEFTYDIYEIGVDAIIVQDLGLADIIHKYIPNLPLHASTQMTVYNIEGVRELQKIGFKRVVLARELSIEEIKNICDNTDVEIEVFVHGALCVCYSGQCLMSSMIGDRSGNRGKCAQPCRMQYSLIENNKEIGKGYLLSPKDLSAIELLKDYPNVTSLKIEGRMKSPEYVATVVSNYRKYIDTGYVLNEDKKDLLQIFNRGGFTTAYLEKKQGSDMMCYEKPKNWGIYVGKVIKYDGKRYITLDHANNINIGDGIEVWNGDNDSPSTIVSEISGDKIGRIHGNIKEGDKVYKTSDKRLNQLANESYSRGFSRRKKVKVSILIKKEKTVKFLIDGVEYESQIIPQQSINKPLTPDIVETQIKKTGNTPFVISELKIELDEGLFLEIKEINEIRRDAFARYEEYIVNKYKRKIDRRKLDIIEDLEKTKPSVSLYITKLKREHTNIKLDNINRVYFSLKDAIKNIDILKEFNCEKYVVMPSITKKNYDKLIRNNIESISNEVDGYIISNIGQIEYLKNIKTKMIANESMNIFNSYTICKLKEMGFSAVTLSPELSKEQINSIKSCLPCEFKIYGRQQIMISEYCVVGSIAGNFSNDESCIMPCTKNNKYYLRDRKNIDFPVIPDSVDCQCQIFNSKITSIASREIKINTVRIDIQDESVNEINNIVEISLLGEKLSGNKYTNGHIARPV